MRPCLARRARVWTADRAQSTVITWFLAGIVVPSTRAALAARSVPHAVPSARAGLLTMATRHESTKRQRPPPTEGHLASISAGAVAEAAAATRSAEENEAIANARVARKALHRARGAGKIDKRDVNCHRYRMVLSYEGAGFHGWQKQTNAGVQLRTVEKVLEDQLRPVLAQSLKFWPSGRTDAGVSASGQAAQFDAVEP